MDVFLDFVEERAASIFGETECGSGERRSLGKTDCFGYVGTLEEI
jgi:hypothetical protein